MKRALIVLVGVVVFAVSPAVATAQGLLGGALPVLPGLPSLGSMFGDDRCASCVDQRPFSLAGTAAWNYETIDLDFRTLSAGLLNVAALKHTYRFNGLQLGLSARAVSRTGFGALASFRILATGSSKDTENYGEDFPGFLQGSRHWRTKNDTYFFDILGFYNVYCASALVGGFRWNHLETTFDRPDGGIGILGLAGDETVLICNIYQPYVGVMVDQGGSSRVLRVGAIGWPQLYGSAEYGETDGGAIPAPARINGMTAKVNEGYFWEIFGEYGLRDQKHTGAAVSVFGKWAQYHLKGTFNADADFVGLGTVDDDYWNITMHRNSWTAGVKLDIPLAFPVPFSF
jgi:hypothetical protein